MFRRRPTLLLVLAALTACDTTAPPTAPEVGDPSYVLIDGTTTGNSAFHVLPPLVMGEPDIIGTFDPTQRPRVEICEWSVGSGTCLPGGATFTYTLSSGVDGEFVRVEDDHYHVNWDTGLDGIDPGKVFRASVFLVTRSLGSVDIEIGETGQDVKNINTGDNLGLVDGRTLPFRFSLVEGVIEEEEARAEAECLNTSGDVVDCDVEIVSSADGSTVVVEEAPGTPDETLAATVTIEEDDVVDENGDPVEEFVLTLQHVETAPAPAQDIPSEQQIPFFVEATAVDAEGDPVFFQVGATLVLCQPPDLGDPSAALFIPDALHGFLKIFQVRDGVTEILPTTLDNQANCPGGLHGGLNTTGLRRFSGFGATLPTLPSASTATVPDGIVGSPTVIDIQAALDASNEQIFGGDEVVVTITGANSATPAVTDNGDGTYTTQYTPSTTGSDNVSIQIRNVVTGSLEPISGSPFTSEVTSATGIALSSTETIFDFDLTGLSPAPPYSQITWTVRFSSADPVSGTDVLITNLYGGLGGTDLVQVRDDTNLITNGGTEYGPLTTANPIYDPMLDGTFSFGLVMQSGTAIVEEFEACGRFGAGPEACQTIPATVTPFLSINDVTVTEGDEGTTSAVFTVTLSEVSTSTVAVDFTTTDGTATSPDDYTSTSGTLTFPPGILTQSITVDVVADGVTESAIESFNVVLSNAVNATIADANGLGSILDDDPEG